MQKLTRLIIAAVLINTFTASAQNTDWHTAFKNPPGQYKPMPFWHMNGRLTNEGIDSQMHDVKYKSNFGGVTVLPVTSQANFTGKKMFPGMEPAYLSDEYFTFYKRILDDARKENLHVIWYDDLDFPSGSAGGRMKQLYPNDTRKILSKKDTVVAGNAILQMPVPAGVLMAAVAMDTGTRQRMEISASIKITF